MSEKPFLERWAGRKAAAREAAPEPEATPQEPEVLPPPAAPDPISEEELAALPPIETLTVGADIRNFLRPGVPVGLKNAALRRMWMLTPAIRDHKDIAVDYAWDWNTPGGVPGDGGSLDPAKVAQWVRELSRPRDRSRVPAGAASEAGEGEPATSTNSPSVLPDKVEGDAPDTSIGSQDRAPGNPSPKREIAAAPARPRHGGARPD